MADEAPVPNDQTVDPNAPQFAPQAVYLKDVSFEAPAGPRIASNAANPTINLNLNTGVSDMGGDMKEVVLTVRVEAKAGDKTVWLWSCNAGAFGRRNVSFRNMQRFLGIFARTVARAK
jgi:preprotein translocase subunit SecB